MKFIITKRTGLWLAIAALFLLALLPGRAMAQTSGSPAPIPTPTASGLYAPVMVDGRRIFDVTSNGQLSAADRADMINRRVQTLIAQPEDIPPFTRQDVKREGPETVVLLGGDVILSVTNGDAQSALMTQDELAMLWGGKIAAAVQEARSVRANPLRGAGLLIKNSFSDLLVSLLQWLPRLAGALVLWIFFYLAARFARWIAHAITKRTHMDENVRQLIRAFAYYGTWSVGLLAIFATLGMNSSGVVAGLGVSGFIIGFAFKDVLSHFFAGLMLLMGRQFHIGDQIVVNSYEGTVERIELRALFLRTYDNRLVIIPNGDVFTSVVTSNTHNTYRRREFVIGIGYSEDIAKAEAVALATMKEVPGVADDPAPDVLIDELTASTVNLRLRFYTASHRADYVKVGSECMRRVKQAFDTEKVSRPSGTQTIVVQNMDTLADALRGVNSGALSPSQAKEAQNGHVAS